MMRHSWLWFCSTSERLLQQVRKCCCRALGTCPVQGGLGGGGCDLGVEQVLKIGRSARRGHARMLQDPQAGWHKAGKCPVIFSHLNFAMSAFVTQPQTQLTGRAAGRTRPRQAGAAEGAPAAGAGASALAAEGWHLKRWGGAKSSSECAWNDYNAKPRSESNACKLRGWFAILCKSPTRRTATTWYCELKSQHAGCKNTHWTVKQSVRSDCIEGRGPYNFGHITFATITGNFKHPELEICVFTDALWEGGSRLGYPYAASYPESDG